MAETFATRSAIAQGWPLSELGRWAPRFFADVIPILQRRGLFRSAYVGTTLRDHLGLAVPSPAR